jgi:hypothetical protein
MKAVEIAVRAAAGLSANDIGKDLMRKAFDVKAGPLTDLQVEPQSARHAAISSPVPSALTKVRIRIEMSPSTIPTRRPKSLCWRTTFCEL